MTIPERVTLGRTLSPANEVDVELLTFVERYATNLARWDLLVYFGRNPSVCDTAHGIAEHVGRRPHAVQKELDDLTYLGLLRARHAEQGMQYELARTHRTRRTVMRFARLNPDAQIVGD
jgi:DNA-binding MarR family transcriptional regulator